jgi:hypothetical protein
MRSCSGRHASCRDPCIDSGDSIAERPRARVGSRRLVGEGGSGARDALGLRHAWPAASMTLERSDPKHLGGRQQRTGRRRRGGRSAGRGHDHPVGVDATAVLRRPGSAPLAVLPVLTGVVHRRSLRVADKHDLDLLLRGVLEERVERRRARVIRDSDQSEMVHTRFISGTSWGNGPT